jgi:hypothetical protein
MTRHKALHTGLVSPSPLDLWINALLHAFAMLMSCVRSICSMRQTRSLAECHSDATLKALPGKESGKLKETLQAAASGHASSSSNAAEGLMLRAIALAIVDSKRSLAVRAADELIRGINSSGVRPEGGGGVSRSQRLVAP